MDNSSFFDNLAPIWDDNEILSTPDKVNEILDYFSIGESEEILDLGTGTGILLPYIAERIGEHGRITAVDYSEGMLKRAKHKYNYLKPKPLFLKKDFEKEPVEGTFDKIILYCVYPHLNKPLECLKKLKDNNLKMKGEIFIAFPTGPDYINNIHKDRKSESDLLPTASLLNSFFNKNGLKAEVLAENDGAYVVKIKK